MTIIANFFLNKLPDHRGRYIDDILKFSNDQMEEYHDYIQWIFPNDVPSMVNPHCPLLTQESVDEFKSNEIMSSNLMVAVYRFCSFLDQTDDWRKKHNHNHLRITRI